MKLFSMNLPFCFKKYGNVIEKHHTLIMKPVHTNYSNWGEQVYLLADFETS